MMRGWEYWVKAHRNANSLFGSEERLVNMVMNLWALQKGREFLD